MPVQESGEKVCTVKIIELNNLDVLNKIPNVCKMILL